MIAAAGIKANTSRIKSAGFRHLPGAQLPLAEVSSQSEVLY